MVPENPHGPLAPVNIREDIMYSWGHIAKTTTRESYWSVQSAVTLRVVGDLALVVRWDTEDRCRRASFGVTRGVLGELEVWDGS